MSTGSRRCTALLLCILMLFSLTGCGGTKHTKTYYTWFDTVTSVIGYDSAGDFDDACAVVEEVLERYHRACDIYLEYSGMNNACTLNKAAGQGPVEVPPELLEVLSFGKEVHQLTGGMCSIAMGAVTALWHESRQAAIDGASPSLPEDAALLEAAKHCRIDDLRIDISNGTAELLDGEMCLDLGAVAKGYAAEKAARALEEAGFTSYALNLGGNVRTIGTKPGREPWVAGIQDPHQDSDSVFLLRVSLSNAALVTSGSYQRYYEVDGVRYHHIIYPKTLYPRNDYLSVTIRGADSGLADALSTAVFNMDADEGFNFINSLDGVEACWVLSNGDIRYSQGFRKFILD